MYILKKFSKFSDKIYGTRNVDFGKIDISEDLNRNNLQILTVSSAMMSAIFAIMFVLSFILPNYAVNRLFYGFETLETCLVIIASLFVFPKTPKLVLPFVYFFMSLLHYYGIYIGIVSQNTNLAVTSCLFLTALPLLFTDDALRMVLFSTAAAVINAVMMINMKSSAILITDLTDVLFSWIMGLALGVEINRLKVMSFIREHEIALERDTDGLTGLWNKNAAVEKISAAISEENAEGAFIIMDLDHFKQINDACGHVCGDEVLVEASEKIRSVFGENDIAGRFGGDEFIVYMPDADEKTAAETSVKLLEALNGIYVPDNDKGLSGSIGIAMYGNSPDMSYDSLMMKADRALYVTKEHGRCGYTVFSEEKMERHAVGTK